MNSVSAWLLANQKTIQEWCLNYVVMTFIIVFLDSRRKCIPYCSTSDSKLHTFLAHEFFLNSYFLHVFLSPPGIALFVSNYRSLRTIPGDCPPWARYDLDQYRHNRARFAWWRGGAKESHRVNDFIHECILSHRIRCSPCGIDAPSYWDAL